MRTAILATFALPLLAGCFMPASVANRAAQRDMDRVRAEAAAEWRRIDGLLGGRGWRPIAEPSMGGLEETYDESDEIRIILPSAGVYTLVGICGSNCIDMDLVLLNSERRRVAADTDPDATPMVVFEGAAGERFTAIVTIPDCRRPAPTQYTPNPKWRCIYFTRLYGR
jgi:hypothetical protein